MKKWIDTRPRTQNRHVFGLSKTGNQGIWSVVLVEDEKASESGTLDWPAFSSGPWPFRTIGEESCIQRTWKLAKLVSSPHQVMTVMKQAHWGYAWKLLIQETLGRVVWQPENRGNALGAFLPLSYIRSHDPDGIVILWSVGPTGELDDSVFDRVQAAIARVNQVPDILVGLECVSNSDDGKEGWDWREGVQVPQGEMVTYVPRQHHGHPVMPIPAKRDGLDERRTVGVLVTRVETLWLAGRRLLPTLLSRLDALGPVLGTSRERQILSDLYHTTPVETLEAKVFPFLRSQLEIMGLPKPSQHRMEANYSNERVES
ncbi:MAG: hypothetical protein AB7T38_09845 [Nitrospirales bacterium]